MRRLDGAGQEVQPGLRFGHGHHAPPLDVLTIKRGDRRCQPRKIRIRRALELNPNDTPSLKHIERREYLSDNPPPEDWDGAWVLESK